MKKVIFLLVICATFIFVACGEKSQEDVLEELDKVLEELDGYKAEAKMTLKTGQEPQVYNVEVSYKHPTFYKVALSNEKEEPSQIILRNEDGVFVLTPALNKSFRFQSDWPETSSQVYLYESLINDILNDPERTFTATDDTYVFQTNTNYTNKSLNQQEIILHKKDLTPSSVSIMDVDLEVLVELDFTSFEMNASFGEGDFDMDRNMNAAKMENEVPAIAEEDEQDESEFTVFFPMYEPQGTGYPKIEEVTTEDGKSVVLSYEGEEPFTLVQQKSRVVDASTPIHIAKGEPVDLGFTYGVLMKEGDTLSVSWSYQGTDFFLASKHLDEENILAVARSVYGTEEK